MAGNTWDDMYRSQEQVFSGEPNGVLVTEVTGLTPGKALDVGCGEGADALWLARRGWQVTAVDVSETALRRGAAAGTDVSGRVEWQCADLTDTAAPAGVFDLVTAHYFPLPRRPDHRSLRALLAAIAPGGVLLFAGHDLADLAPGQGHGGDPRDYYQPGEVAGLLDDDWDVLVDETRPRTAPAPPGTHHTHDTVLLARRLR